MLFTKVPVLNTSTEHRVDSSRFEPFYLTLAVCAAYSVPMSPLHSNVYSVTISRNRRLLVLSLWKNTTCFNNEEHNKRFQKQHGSSCFLVSHSKVTEKDLGFGAHCELSRLRATRTTPPGTHRIFRFPNYGENFQWLQFIFYQTAGDRAWLIQGLANSSLSKRPRWGVRGLSKK